MRIRPIPGLIVLSLLAVAATACSAAPAAQQPGPSLGPALTAIATPAPAAAQPTIAGFALPAETRSDSEGSVTVEVTPAAGAAGTLVFDVVMNTHNVELDHDMTKIATLRDDQGFTYPVKSWDGATGGHHRQGTLSFEAPAGPAPKWLELNLSGISGVPSRLFRWDTE